MKKILLIAPPFYRLMGSHYNGLHLGIGYIAAVLNEHGRYAKVYNADYYESKDFLNQRQLFDSYSSYKLALDDLDSPIWHEIKDNIYNFGPDIVGITMLTANYKAAVNISNIVKSLDKEIKVVVGGTHPTLNPDGVIRAKDFDYLIRGEGEFSFLELADGLKANEILGLSYKESEKIIHNKSRPFIDNLDILPFPARHSFLNSTKHLDAGAIATGRGCPFSCTYCASPQIWHRITRFRSVPNIMEELRYLKENYASTLLQFVDDTFSLNKGRAKELCRQIIKENLNIKWKCDTRVDCLDKELISLMKEAGCIRMKLGVESGSDRILKGVKKGFTKEKVRQGIALIKEFDMPLTIYLMAGFPGETNEDLKETIEFAKELDADYYSLSILAPYYGTQIYRELEEAGKKLDKEHWEYFYHQSRDMIINSNLDPKIVDEFLALNEREGKGERV